MERAASAGPALKPVADTSVFTIVKSKVELGPLLEKQTDRFGKSIETGADPKWNQRRRSVVARRYEGTRKAKAKDAPITLRMKELRPADPVLPRRRPPRARDLPLSRRQPEPC